MTGPCRCGVFPSHMGHEHAVLTPDPPRVPRFAEGGIVTGSRFPLIGESGHGIGMMPEYRPPFPAYSDAMIARPARAEYADIRVR